MVIRSRPERSARALVLAVAITIGSAQLSHADNRDIEVLIDQATMLRLERSAAEIIVGNPSIADVSVQNSKVIVLTGKSFGETNLIALDSAGKTLVNRRVRVAEPSTGYLTMYRGANRQTLHCSPNCEIPLVIGDTERHFSDVAKEIRQKQAIGQASAEGENQRE